MCNVTSGSLEGGVVASIAGSPWSTILSSTLRQLAKSQGGNHEKNLPKTSQNSLKKKMRENPPWSAFCVGNERITSNQGFVLINANPTAFRGSAISVDLRHCEKFAYSIPNDQRVDYKDTDVHVGSGGNMF